MHSGSLVTICLTGPGALWESCHNLFDRSRCTPGVLSQSVQQGHDPIQPNSHHKLFHKTLIKRSPSLVRCLDLLNAYLNAYFVVLRYCTVLTEVSGLSESNALQQTLHLIHWVKVCPFIPYLHFFFLKWRLACTH